VDHRLQLAFGREVRDVAIKLEFRAQRLVLAADCCTFGKDGRLRFAPCWLIRDEGAGRGGAPPELLTLRCRVLHLTLDRPVRDLAEVGRRRVVAIEPSGEVRLALPVLTPPEPPRPKGGTAANTAVAQTAEPVFVVEFVDSGTVTSRINPIDYRVSAGIGTRFVLPMLGPVPVALDFGFPLHREASRP
jgi:hypothetical protein